MVYKEEFEYVLIDNGHAVYAAEVEDDKSGGPKNLTVDPLGRFDIITGDNDTETLIYVEDSYGNDNEIIITSASLDYVNLEEFMSILQDDPVLGKLFDFELTPFGINNKDEYLDIIEDNFAAALGSDDPTRRYWGQYVIDTITGAPVYRAATEYTFESSKLNKTFTYDYTKYIPYRTDDNFVRQLAQHCTATSLRTKMTHGVIGYSTLRNYSLKSLAKRADELINAKYSLYAKKYNGRMMLNGNNEPYEIGANVSVTAYQFPTSDGVNNYITRSNGAATYAGMISNLPVEQSTTMQPIGLTNVDYEFSHAQMKDITNAGYIVVRNTVTKGLCIVDGVTMAPATQYRRRFSVVRTVNECGDAIRVAAEPFIGKKNSLANRSALKTAVDSALHQFVGTLIWDYRFEVVNLSSYTDDAFININYWIFPINEIREVDNSITVTRQTTQTE